MATSATIHSIGAWRPPTRSNTTKGSRYLLREGGLTTAKRRKLRALEDSLLDGLACCDDSKGALDRPERLHQVPGEGYIAYFFSRKEQYYILSDFGFDDSGTGGVPCTNRLMVGGYGQGERPARRRAAGGLRSALRAGAHRIEEAMASLLAHFRSASAIWPLGVNRTPPTMMHVRGYSAVGLATDVLQTHALLAGNGPIDREDLPTWSVLRDMISVSEELRSPLARSIMAGELVCRLGSVTDVATRLVEDRAPSRWRILQAVPVKDDGHRVPWEALVATWLAGSEDIGPRERLEARTRLMARAKLSMLVATHVRRTTDELLINLDAGENLRMVDSHRQQILMKMHLVTEYIALSYCMFDGFDWEVDPSLKGTVPDEAVAGCAYVFEEFDRSIELIAKEVHGNTTSRRGASAPLQERISGLIKQILDVPTNGSA